MYVIIMDSNLIQYVNLTKAAKLTGVSITKIYRFIHAGELEVFSKNGEYVVNVEDLLKVNKSIRDCELFEPTFMTLISHIEDKK